VQRDGVAFARAYLLDVLADTREALMAAATAESIAKNWSSRKQRHDEDDLKGLGLPLNVQQAILDVENHSHDLAERVAWAEELHAVQPDHELALEPGAHGQSTRAYRFEEVGGEIVEVRKDSHDSPVKLIHRPDLTPPDAVDPLAALQSRLQADGQPEG
jgi:hypothetical protein